jgi:hypothetical protein
VRLQISHLIFAGKKSWPTAQKAVQLIEKAQGEGLEVMFDIYPHFCGNSYLTVFLPAWFMENLDANLKSTGAIRRLRIELSLAKFLVGFNMAECFQPDMFQPVMPLPQDSPTYRRRTGSGVCGTKFTPYLQHWGSYHEKIEVTDEASWSFGNRMHDDFFLCGTATCKYRYPQRPAGGLSVQTQLCQQPDGR